MLDFFRKGAKSWVAKLLFGLLVLSFLAWGVEDVFREKASNQPAIQVGDTEVSAAEVMFEFRQEIERLQPMFGGKLTTEDAKKMGLLDQTVATMATRALIKEASNRLGLTASQEDVAAYVAKSPAFRNASGQFDPDLMRRLLARSGLTESRYLDLERDNLVRNQMAQGFSSGAHAPQALQEPVIKLLLQQRVAEIIEISDSSIPAPALPARDVLEQFYKDNPEPYMAPQYRSLSAALIKISNFVNDVEVTDEMIAESYHAREEEFVTPERRDVSQIVLADQAQVDQARNLAEQGKDLTAISKALGIAIIDLGQLAQKDLPQELADTVFSLKEGGTSAPIQTSLGWHVVKVSKLHPGSTKALEQVKAQLVRDIKAEKALDHVTELGVHLEDAVASGDSLDEAAQRLGLALIKVDQVNAQGLGPDGKKVASLQWVETILEVAFHTEVGDHSGLTELNQDGYFMVRVDSITEPQPKAFAEVQSQVQANWVAAQRHILAKQKAEKIMADINGGKSAQNAAGGVKVVTTKPISRQQGHEDLPQSLLSQLFTLDQGKAAMAEDEGKWVVAQLAKVVEFDASTNPEAATQVSQQLAQSVNMDLIDQFLTALRADLGVKINRNLLERE